MMTAEQMFRSLAQELLAVCEVMGEHLDMEDGPCPHEELCGQWLCREAGCIKDKADLARAALAKATALQKEG